MVGRCGDCRFWNQTKLTRVGTGQCRARPPEAVNDKKVQLQALGVWPITRKKDWCGLHQRG